MGAIEDFFKAKFVKELMESNWSKSDREYSTHIKGLPTESPTYSGNINFHPVNHIPFSFWFSCDREDSFVVNADGSYCIENIGKYHDMVKEISQKEKLTSDDSLRLNMAKMIINLWNNPACKFVSREKANEIAKNAAEKMFG